MSEPLTNRAIKIWDALPQTQCTRCGYPDCEAYARAIDTGDAPINQCPPGGQQGIERLAALMQAEPLPLNPDNGIEAPRVVVWIDENWCIGCTLCIKACPVDAIVGANKRMHTVIESECNGCELCIPACPVDCILTETISGDATGWAAWGQAEADNSRQRYLARKARLVREAEQREKRHLQALQTKAKDLSAHSQITDPALLDKKKSVIELALARARAKAGHK